MKTKQNAVRIVVAKDIQIKGGTSKKWGIYKRKYNRLELKPFINGKKVRYWLKVCYADNEDCDRYVPLFYKKKRKKKI